MLGNFSILSLLGDGRQKRGGIGIGSVVEMEMEGEVSWSIIILTRVCVVHSMIRSVDRQACWSNH